jgi:hypothetical protein
VAELLDHRVDGLLGHEPVGRQLAAGDRDEAADAVALAVVQQRGAAADVARRAAGLLVVEERSDARPHAQRAVVAEARHEPLAVGEHRVDLLLRDREVVRVLGADVRRPDDADGSDRDDDVAVGGHGAAVDHRVHDPVVHRDHDALAGDDGDALDARHLGDLVRPGAGGIDGEAGLDLDRLARALVVQARAGDGVALAAQLDAAVVGEDARAARGGAVRESPDQLPHVDGRVGDGERPPDARVEHRLAAQRLGDVDLLRRQPGLGAAREELVAVGGIVVGRRDEEPARVLDRRGRDAADDRVLLHALTRRDRILHDIAPAGVQQAVEAAARALGEVGAVDEDDVVPAQCGVPGDPGAGAAATDDEHLGLQRGHAAIQSRTAGWRARARHPSRRVVATRSRTSRRSARRPSSST